MPAVEIFVQDQRDLVGLPVERVIANAAGSGGNKFYNDGFGEIHLDIINGSGSALVLTVISARPSNFGVYPNHTETIPVDVGYVTRGFDPRRFNDLEGFLTFSFDIVTFVEIAAVRRQKIYQAP